MRWFLALVLLLVATTTAFAQPVGCPTEPMSVTVNPTKIRAELADQERIMLDGLPAVTGYVLGWYAEGASAPTSQLPVAKATFSLVPATTFCYDAPLPPLTGIPIGQKYFAALKTLRGTEESAWSVPSNPFGFENPPVPPGWTRVKK